jgi:hypothetical protein
MKYLIIFIIVSSQYGYGQQNTIKEKQKQVEQFVSYLKDNNQQAIYDICFHASSGFHITNEAMRIRYVKSASDLIHKYGLTPKSKWIFTSDDYHHLYSYVVEIPLSINPDSSAALHLIKASIMIYFPPEQISNLIFEFNIFSKTNFNGTVEPPRNH